MKLSHALGFPLAIVALAAFAFPPEQSSANQNQDVVSQARGAYYSLARKGFKGFTATIEPNWEVILAETATPANLKIFRAVQFSMVVDATGVVTVTHEVSADAAKPDLQPTVNRIHYDIQRLVTGFFNTWRIFAVGSAFPETASDAKIEKFGKQYRVFYSTQSGDVTIAMTSDLLMTEWNISAPTAKRTVKPKFQKTVDGLLLTSYHGVFEPVGNGIKTTLDFQIEYQDVSGMKVPRKLRFNGMHGSEPVEAELIFTIKGQ